MRESFAPRGGVEFRMSADGRLIQVYPEPITEPTPNPFVQSYEDYLSDEPDAWGIPDGLTREEYESLVIQVAIS